MALLPAALVLWGLVSGALAVPALLLVPAVLVVPALFVAPAALVARLACGPGCPGGCWPSAAAACWRLRGTFGGSARLGRISLPISAQRLSRDSASSPSTASRASPCRLRGPPAHPGSVPTTWVNLATRSATSGLAACRPLPASWR